MRDDGRFALVVHLLVIGIDVTVIPPAILIDDLAAGAETPGAVHDGRDESLVAIVGIGLDRG